MTVKTEMSSNIKAANGTLTIEVPGDPTTRTTEESAEYEPYDHRKIKQATS